MVLIRNDPAPCSRGYLALMFWVGPAQTVPQVRTCSPTCTLCLPGNASALPTDRSLINLLCSGSCSCCRRTLVPAQPAQEAFPHTTKQLNTGDQVKKSFIRVNQKNFIQAPHQSSALLHPIRQLITETSPAPSPHFNKPRDHSYVDYHTLLHAD